jgi:hypothetical protein
VILRRRDLHATRIKIVVDVRQFYTPCNADGSRTQGEGLIRFAFPPSQRVNGRENLLVKALVTQGFQSPFHSRGVSLRRLVQPAVQGSDPIVRRALEFRKLPHHGVQDSRHFYAIRALRAGTPYELVARQFHADVQMVARVYGRYAPRSDERDRSERIAAELDKSPAIAKLGEMGTAAGTSPNVVPEKPTSHHS